MKKIAIKALTVLLVIMLLCTSLSVCRNIDLSFLTANAEAKTWKTGDIGYMGWYPQSKVEDTKLLLDLNSLSLNWISYGYYSGDDSAARFQGDWMKYADTFYNGSKYRAVRFTQYRPVYTNRHSSEDNSFQDDNGFFVGTTYWFRYDPIAWKVLSPSTGLVLSYFDLDSQAYNNKLYSYGQECYCDIEFTAFSNDYVSSSIRKWLNNDFYNLAFSSEEQAAIMNTPLNNWAYSSEYSKYNSASTIDKLFLLSWAESHNYEYGFSSDIGKSSTRYVDGTEYAKCQGLYVSSFQGEYYQKSGWLLRTPGYRSYCASNIFCNGDGDIGNNVTGTTDGIRVALRTDLQSQLFKSIKPESISDPSTQITQPSTEKNENTTILPLKESTEATTNSKVQSVTSTTKSSESTTQKLILTNTTEQTTTITNFTTVYSGTTLISEHEITTVPIANEVSGDLDGDSDISAADARLTLRAAVGLDKLTDALVKAADVDSDGMVTSADARLILRAAIGLEKLIK